MTPSTTVEFLIWMLIAAALIAVLAARLRIPYTVALVVGGLLLGSFHLPILKNLFAHPPDWLTPDVTLVIFLPALLFEGSLKIQLQHLRKNLVPICLLATLGVLAATLICGFAVHWALGMPVLVALVFGAIVAATDPISVLAIFKDTTVGRRLTIIVEGESLFNDGTSVVVFGILFGAVVNSHLSIAAGVRDFFVEVTGGVTVGVVLGFIFSKLTARINDPQIEITLTTILAYSSYLLAQSLHMSGVIATVAAGLMMGNFGMRTGMSWRTRIALWSFWEYASFLINSILFLLIGLQVRVGELLHMWQVILLTIAAVFAGRVLTVYGIVPISNLFTEKIPLRWQHVMVWGGMRGAISLALVLSIGNGFPYRDQLLTMTFGVVAFTIIVQGISMKPLIRLLGIGKDNEDDFSRARVRQVSIASAISELEGMAEKQLISRPVHAKLRHELDARLEHTNQAVETIYGENHARLSEEFEVARARLNVAEKSAIEQAMHDGWVSANTASKMIAETDTASEERSEAAEEAERSNKSSDNEPRSSDS
ncbi:MAG TPA: Na+/H+ antiporter [Terriglobales bacterium]|jgi:CPA1 family monovalent cation:H+ antiporter